MAKCFCCCGRTVWGKSLPPRSLSWCPVIYIDVPACLWSVRACLYALSVCVGPRSSLASRSVSHFGDSSLPGFSLRGGILCAVSLSVCVLSCVCVCLSVWSGHFSDLWRTPGDTLADAALSGSNAWSVYVVLRCVACSVWRSGTTVRPYRLLLELLQTRMVGAFVAVSGMNEMESSYMKDLVRCFLLCCSCLAFSRSVSLFDGTMPRSLVTGVRMRWRLRRCRRSCGLRGWSASIVVGARFCGGPLSCVFIEACSSGPHRARVLCSLWAPLRS